MLKGQQQSQTNGKGGKGDEEKRWKIRERCQGKWRKRKIREWVKVNTLTLAQRSVLASKWSRAPDLRKTPPLPGKPSQPTSTHLTECISSRLFPRFLCLFAQCVFTWLHCLAWVGKAGKIVGLGQWKIGTRWGKNAISHRLATGCTNVWPSAKKTRCVHKKMGYQCKAAPGILRIRTYTYYSCPA